MLDKDYWQKRYKDHQIGWDTGGITTPIKAYFDQVINKDVSILIPGCGNAHEASYLYKNGFKNVFLCDWAAAPLDHFAAQNLDFPKHQLLCNDFFELSSGPYDYIIEQTFFCALTPSMRPDYVQQIYQLLKKGGKLVGLLFDIEFEKEGPPFGGTKAAYYNYFNPVFDTVRIDKCYNSIKPRQGAEVFIEICK